MLLLLINNWQINEKLLLGFKPKEINITFILTLNWYNPNSLLLEHLSNHVVHTVITSNVSVFVFLWWFRFHSLPLCFSLIDSVEWNTNPSHHLPPATECLVVEPILEWFPSNCVYTCSPLVVYVCFMNLCCVTLIVASESVCLRILQTIANLYLDHLSHTGIGLSAAQHDSSQCSQDKHLGQELSPNSVHFAVLNKLN